MPVWFRFVEQSVRGFLITPLYVTTDAMLELWPALNRELLNSTERQVCIPQLSTLLPALEMRAKTLYEGAHEEKAFIVGYNGKVTAFPLFSR